MIEILEIKPNNDSTRTRAFASVHLPGDVVIHQVRVVETRTGEMFIQLPAILDRASGKFSPCVVLSSELKSELESALLGAYWKL